jgi:hypothetical protein
VARDVEWEKRVARLMAEREAKTPRLERIYPYERLARDEAQRQAREFIEHEVNRGAEITPTEAIREDLDRAGHPMAAKAVGYLQMGEDDDEDTRQAAKAGDADRFSVARNFLATDKVPDTIFGIPIVSNEDDYAPEDLAFFREHPEAGGYYDMGEGTPEDGTEEGMPTQDDEPTAFMERNPTLFSHVKSFEKLRLEPYEDVGGHAIGYGAHADAAGNAVTADTPAIDEATADAMLARDLYARREKLARTLPNWNRIPGNARQALLDVSMGKDGIMSAKESKGLRADLAAAGEDPAKLLAAVKKHYYSYLSKDPKYRAGLMARRVAGGKTFFGEDFSYEGKTWDPAVGFTATAAPSLPAKKRKASGGSTRSKGDR